MSFKPSKYQQDIFDFIKTKKGNLVINAVAGSGKTSTIIESIKLFDKNTDILFLAFNKSIKNELVKRINNPDIEINTCHGFGYSTILSNFDTNPILNNNKYKKLLKDLIDYNISEDDKIIKTYEFDESLKDNLFGFNLNWKDSKDKKLFEDNVLKLVNMMRLNAYQDRKDIEDILIKFDIDLTEDEILLSLKLLMLGQSLKTVIDFTDMLYYPLIYDLNITQYDVILIDEAQDLSNIQRLLILKSVKPNGRLIFVGDKNQAIYSFAGADADSFDKISNLPNTTLLPLSECYRCGSNILETIKHIVPHITAFKSNPNGNVNYNASIEDVKDGDMVLCRNTYPLVKLCMKFISEHKKATVMGSDIGKQLIKQLESTNETDVKLAFAKLYDSLNTILERIMRVNNLPKDKAMSKGEYVNALEKINVFQTIYANMEPKSESVQDIINKLNEIFSDTRNGIMLSTIHRAKGLESDNVFIIHYDLMPSKYATQEWEMTQENNLIYVAKTRAKNNLSIVTDFDAYDNANCEIVDISNIIIKESKHVGTIGQRMTLTGEIIDIKHIESYNEDVYIVKDKEGNIFEHWGRIPHHFVIVKNIRIKIGTKVKGPIKITKHTTFNDVNKNGFKCLK